MVTMGGNAVTLEGKMPKIGETAPDFTLVKKDMQAASLKDFRGKVVILSTVPSLDTPVCSLETRKFNQAMDKLDGNIVVLTISKDLPFAAARWCAAQGVEKVVTLSDYRNGQFGIDYGVLMKEPYLLARAVFVLNKEGVITYTDIMEDVSKEPKYDEVINEAKKNL